MKLLLATSNPGKVLELRHLLQSVQISILTPHDIGLKLIVPEVGKTYHENARSKALAFSEASGLTALADDSGLEVDFLDGEPGVNSARYAGEDADDRARIEKLLGKLRGVPWDKRTARFRCVIALASPDGMVDFAEGSCDGIITLAPKGASGFGYDPVFYFPEYDMTMAELPMELKNRVSHRGKAMAAALPIIERILKRPRNAWPA